MHLAQSHPYIRDLVDLADKRIKERTPPRKQGNGRSPTDPANIAKTLLLETYPESSNGSAERFLLLFREKLGISSSFSYKTIERGYDRKRVNEIPDEIMMITSDSEARGLWEYDMQYLLWEAFYDWLKNYHVRSLCLRRCFAFGNGQFNGEVPVWRSRLRKRTESRKETDVHPKRRPYR
ncbi:MAG: hypothetical protein C4B59_16045 [Candidatus Methanogaster sp.]|uniref:Uncharacterized protein n=1 Tax=Candidatus Methanogaster sp. TaxID=3386292 RepID=A0AC61KYC6_9EURY|nr:MAG: hypothetical protein C4B59_16045 [ANME-2 cluster archaeon]